MSPLYIKGSGAQRQGGGFSNMSQQHILVVEDDEPLAEWIKDYLQKQHYQVSLVHSGLEANEAVRKLQPDLVMLDIMLPGKNGDAICQALREFYRCPIVMMTASDDEASEVLCLQLGADDYLTKPVRPRAMLARIQLLLRRAQSTDESSVESMREQLQVANMTLDRACKNVTYLDQHLKISNHEFDVLWSLAGQYEQVVSRAQLVSQLRGIDYDGFDRSIDIRVSRLRKKLDAANAPVTIKTVWGKGYLLTEQNNCTG